jgi:FkbM family methyltransferase
MSPRVGPTLRGVVMGTWLESPARFVWKKILRRRTKNDLYDLLTAEIMRRRLRPDSNCVDIGCHAGAILDEMLALAPRGVHHAFEPLPHLAAALRAKYAGRPNVVLHELALSNAAGTTTFHANRDHPGMSGLERRDYLSEHDRVDRIQVRTDRLDAILPTGVRVDFMKVDVEGAESLVFEGAELCLRRDRPVVVFEHGTISREFYGAGSGVVFELLAAADLHTSLLEEYVRGGPPLSREDFIRQVEAGLNFYFVAHP